MLSVIFPSKNKFLELQSFLSERSAEGNEAAALVLCGFHRASNRYLVRSIILPEEDCFDYRTPGGVRIKGAFDREIMNIAVDSRLTVMQVHTHPFAQSSPVSFSSADDHYEHNRADVLLEAFKMPLISMVFNRDATHWQSRIWCNNGNGLAPEQINVQKEPLDWGSLHGVQNIQPRFDRQVRAFGSEFQRRMGSISVGIVGLGGLGISIVEGLARLGVTHFTLVEPDCVEQTNLNRLTGSTISDAKNGTRKVDLAERLIKGIHGSKAKCCIKATKLPDKTVSRQLAKCDILVAATDDHAGRLEVMSIGSAYLRPVVNCGVHLDAVDGTVKRILTRVAAIAPGAGSCIYCTGQIDPLQAAREASDAEHQHVMRESGYLPDTPNPAVWWVNQSAATTAVRLIHGIVYPFGNTEESPYRDILIDHLAGEQINLAHRLNTNCPICSSSGKAGLGDQLFRKVRLSMLNLAPD
jgi:molybdopterin/thiamine biosynthesis adenylyltransferase